ncbi:MAG: mechanosensitive ion channel family protein [Christensenellales bacterium]
MNKLKRPMKKLTKRAIQIIVIVLALTLTVLTGVFSSQLYGEDSVFNQALTDNDFVNTLFNKIPAMIKSIQIISLAVVIYWLIKYIMRKSFADTKRALTIHKLLVNFLKWVIALATLMLVLGAWGVNTGTLLAGAGILTLVIGLGAQSLVSDIVAGMFIVFEGEFEVGDIVVINGWRGTVQEVGIRTTKIVDAGGNVNIVNNSQITSIINQTQEISVAKCQVGIEYGASIPKVEEVIKNNLDKIKENIPAIVDGPFYLGVSELGESSVNLLITAKCKEEDVFQVQRDLNREIKLLFDNNGINIPFPQVVVNQPAPKD